MHKKFGSVFLLALLSIMAATQGLAVLPGFSPLSSVAVSTQTCDAAHTIHATMEPIPDTFNDLNAHGSADFIIAWAQKLSLSPFPDLANGSLDWSQAITNSITSNSNYTQWVFHIKPGMKWSDGTNVTAQDVVNTYSPSYALNPSYDIEALGTEITSATANSSSTAVFNLNTTDAHFPEKISNFISFSIEPPADVAAGPAYNMFGTDVGDGPWYLSQNYTSGSTQLVFSANQYFQPKTSLCEMDVNFVESAGYMNQFLTSGQTDIAWPLSPGSVSSLLNYPNVHVVATPAQWETAIQWNPAVYPYNVTEFRQAIAYAINDSQIVESMFGYGVPANNATGGVPPTVPWYDKSQVNYAYNATKAESMLQSLGFTYDSKGALHYANGTKVALTLWTDTAKPQDIPAAPLVQADLAAIGIDVTLETVSVQDLSANFSPTSTSGEYYDMILYSSGGPVFTDQWLDGQEPCNVMGTPGCHATIMTPTSALNDYMSNLTALDATYNSTQEQVYLNNIQSLQSTYLPVLPLAYPDIIVGYTTNHFTGWPQSPSVISLQPERFNATMFAGLQPCTPSTCSSSTSSTSTGSGNQSTTSSGVTQTTSMASTSTTGTGGGTSSSNGLIYIAIAVVIAVIAVAGSLAYVARSRRR